MIEAVEARGKHLLVRFADGAVLRTHMRMTGSWHLYRGGEMWRRPQHLMRALVEVDGWLAVCFSAPVVSWERGPGGPLSDILDHLGPDLCLADADLDAAVDRMARWSGDDDEIKPVLLDQRVACGVGNVYASEVLFACGVDPFAPVASLDDATRKRLLATASKLLRANLGAGPRTTVSGGLAVYGRRGRPCHRCGTPVRMTVQGDDARVTFWCPSFQPSRRCVE
ncbi:Fpg/Nei family DNA glycosylase [soil metagenome]